MLSRLKTGVLLGMAVLLAAGGISLTPASAQDASPTPVECVSPGLPEGTPTPMDEGMGEMDMASPEAGGEGEASPEAVEIPIPPTPPTGTPAEGDVLAAIDAAARNYAACLAQGAETDDPALYVALESSNFIMNSVGTTNPHDRVASEMMDGIQSFELHDVTNHQVHEDGRVSANIHGIVDGHWLVNVLAFFVEQDGTWLYDEEHFQNADTSFAESVTVFPIDIIETTDESSGEITYAFEFLGGSTVTANEVITLNITNKGSELHEAAAVQLPEGADPMGILDGSVAFEDVTFLGVAYPIRPGETFDLAFVDLEPGVYTLVCFVPGPDGAPHAAHGMVAQFEVVAPAE